MNFMSKVKEVFEKDVKNVKNGAIGYKVTLTPEQAKIIATICYRCLVGSSEKRYELAKLGNALRSYTGVYDFNEFIDTPFDEWCLRLK